MGWLIVDVVIAYVYKSTVRLFWYFRSSSWKRVAASLTEWSIVDPDWGCPSVKLHYIFSWDEGSLAGLDEIPFQMRWHAKTYAESLSRKLQPIIRVNLKRPDQTHFFEFDQKG